MVSNVSGVNGFAPTSRPRPPQEIMNERMKQRQRENLDKLYEDLSAREKNGEKLSDFDQMQLYFLKALKIAEKLPQPTILYNA